MHDIEIVLSFQPDAERLQAKLTAQYPAVQIIGVSVGGGDASNKKAGDVQVRVHVPDDVKVDDRALTDFVTKLDPASVAPVPVPDISNQALDARIAALEAKAGIIKGGSVK